MSSERFCEICNKPISSYNKTGKCFHHEFEQRSQLFKDMHEHRIVTTCSSPTDKGALTEMHEQGRLHRR